MDDARQVFGERPQEPTEAGLNADTRYNKSPKGKARTARYLRSAKRRQVQARYERTAKGRATSARYRRTEPCRSAKRRWWRKSQPFGTLYAHLRWAA